MGEVTILEEMIDLALPSCGLTHPAIQRARDLRDRTRTDDPPTVDDVLASIAELASVLRRRETVSHVRAYP